MIGIGQNVYNMIHSISVNKVSIEKQCVKQQLSHK